MISYRIQGGVELPRSERGKYHILKMAERGTHRKVRFCGSRMASDSCTRISVTATARQHRWCATCIRKYAAYRLKYGYGPIEQGE